MVGVRSRKEGVKNVISVCFCEARGGEGLNCGRLVVDFLSKYHAVKCVKVGEVSEAGKHMNTQIQNVKIAAGIRQGK